MKKYLTIIVLIFSTSAFGDFGGFIKKQAKDTEGDGKIAGCEIWVGEKSDSTFCKYRR